MIICVRKFIELRNIHKKKLNLRKLKLHILLKNLFYEEIKKIRINGN